MPTVHDLIYGEYRAVFSPAKKFQVGDLEVRISRVSSNLPLGDFEIFASMDSDGDMNWQLPAWFIATEDVRDLIKAVASLAKELINA